MRQLLIQVDAGQVLCESCDRLESRVVGGIKHRYRCTLFRPDEDLRESEDGPMRSAVCLAVEQR